MRKISIKTGDIIAKVVKFSAVLSVNTACGLFYYQPKMPKTAKKLRKF